MVLFLWFCMVCLTMCRSARAELAPDSIWHRTWGGPGSDGASALCLTTQNKLVVAGWMSAAPGALWDAQFTGLDQAGNLEWQLPWGSDSCWEYAAAVLPWQNGGALVVVSRITSCGQRGVELLTVTAWGQPSDPIECGPPGDFEFAAILPTASGAVLLGNLLPPEQFDPVPCLLMWDPDAGAIFHSLAQPESTCVYRATSMVAVSACEYVIAGVAPGTVADVMLQKVDSSGAVLWSQRYHCGRSDFDNIATSIAVDPEGGCVVAGWTGPRDRNDVINPDLFMLAVDWDGTPQWDVQFADDAENICYSMIPTSDNGYLLSSTVRTGMDSNAMRISHRDSFGRELWSRTWQPGSAGALTGLLELSDHSYLLAGAQLAAGDGNWNALLLRTGSDSHLSAPVAALPVEYPFSVYPNPFNIEATVFLTLPEAGPVTLELFDVQGRLLRTLFSGTHARGELRQPIQGSAFASGRYFVSVRTPGARIVRPLTLIR